jgi:hypothetical protein
MAIRFKDFFRADTYKKAVDRAIVPVGAIFAPMTGGASLTAALAVKRMQAEREQASAQKRFDEQERARANAFFFSLREPLTCQS